MESEQILYLKVDFLFFLGDVLGLIYYCLKFYRVICFAKITFDQLVLFNPYKWPLSAVRVAASPFFRFWSKQLPNLKVGRFSYDISAIIGLEVLYIFMSLILQIRNHVLGQGEELLKNESGSIF